MAAKEDAFALEYLSRKQEIQKLAYSQRVPGMGYDEVRQELIFTLWRAVDTYRPAAGGSLSQWWWTLWVNHKRNLIESYFTIKNRSSTPFAPMAMNDLVELAECFAPMLEIEDLCPSTDPREKLMWRMLALNFEGQEIRGKLSLSQRRFYAILSRWQTDDVRKHLAGGYG